MQESLVRRYSSVLATWALRDLRGGASRFRCGPAQPLPTKVAVHTLLDFRIGPLARDSTSCQKTIERKAFPKLQRRPLQRRVLPSGKSFSQCGFQIALPVSQVLGQGRGDVPGLVMAQGHGQPGLSSKALGQAMRSANSSPAPACDGLDCEFPPALPEEGRWRDGPTAKAGGKTEERRVRPIEVATR